MQDRQYDKSQDRQFVVDVDPLSAQRALIVQSALARVRQAAGKDKKLQFTALLHHIYNPAMLREAYFGLKRDAAPGVDGQTWLSYGRDLEANLQDLSVRLKRGAYRAKPARRAYIPKPDGRERPLSTSVVARWTSLSSSVVTPNGHSRPSGLGMYALRAGLARYAPRFSRAERSRRFVSRFCPYDRHVCPSTPGAASRLRPK